MTLGSPHAGRPALTGVPITSLYSRGDQIVPWQATAHSGAVCRERRGSGHPPRPRPQPGRVGSDRRPPRPTSGSVAAVHATGVGRQVVEGLVVHALQPSRNGRTTGRDDAPGPARERTCDRQRGEQGGVGDRAVGRAPRMTDTDQIWEPATAIANWTTFEAACTPNGRREHVMARSRDELRWVPRICRYRRRA